MNARAHQITNAFSKWQQQHANCQLGFKPYEIQKTEYTEQEIEKPVSFLVFFSSFFQTKFEFISIENIFTAHKSQIKVFFYVIHFFLQIMGIRY